MTTTNDRINETRISTSSIGKFDPGVKERFDKLNRAISRRTEERRSWNENRDYAFLKIRMRGKDDFASETDEPTPNKIGAWMRRREAALTLHRPKALVTPINGAGYEAVEIPTGELDETGQPVVTKAYRHKVLEGIVNHIATQPSFGMDRAVARGIRNGLLAMGVVSVGYEPLFQSRDNTKLLYVDEQGAPIIDPASQDYVKAGPEEAGSPHVGEFQTDDKGRLQKDAYGNPLPAVIPVSERWFAESVNPDNMLFDPDGYEEYRDHEWVAYEYFRRLSDVKRDPLLKNTRDLSATTPDRRILDDEKEKSSFDHSEERAKNRDRDGWVRLFRIFDFREKLIIELAEGSGRYLRKDPIPRGIDHSPFCLLRFEEKPETIYPHPPVSNLVPITREIYVLRQMQTLMARRAQRKTLVRKGALDETNTAALTSPDECVVEIDAEGGPMSEAIGEWRLPPMSMDILAALRDCYSDFDESGNQSAEARGKKQATTATQSNNLMAGTDIVDDLDRAITATWIREIYKKLVDSIQANMTTDQAVMIEGPDGQAFQGYVNPEMIIGDYDVEVNIEEMTPKNSEVRRAHTTQLLGILAQMPPHMLTSEPFVQAIMDQYEFADPRAVEGLVESAKIMLAQQMQAQVEQANQKKLQGEAAPPEDQAQMMAQQGGRAAQGG